MKPTSRRGSLGPNNCPSNAEAFDLKRPAPAIIVTMPVTKNTMAVCTSPPLAAKLDAASRKLPPARPMQPSSTAKRGPRNLSASQPPNNGMNHMKLENSPNRNSARLRS